MVDGEDALLDYAWILDASTNFPDALRLVAEAALGRPVPFGTSKNNKADECLRSELIKDGILDNDGKVDETLRKVVLASVKISPNGPIIKNPFRMQTQADADLLNSLIETNELCGLRTILDEFLIGPSRHN